VIRNTSFGVTILLLMLTTDNGSNTNFISKKCIPCEGGVSPMKDEEIEKYLPIVPNWILEEGKLVRRFKFKNFKEAIAFVNKVADLAEEEQHHPNISIYGWNNVKLTCFTHKIKGLHLNDFILAAKVNELITFSQNKG